MERTLASHSAKDHLAITDKKKTARIRAAFLFMMIYYYLSRLGLTNLFGFSTVFALSASMPRVRAQK